MKCEILFKDESILTIENVRKVTNASTNIPDDWLYIYSLNDIDGVPSFRYPMNRIVCVEVRDK